MGSREPALAPSRDHHHHVGQKLLLPFSPWPALHRLHPNSKGTRAWPRFCRSSASTQGVVSSARPSRRRMVSCSGRRAVVTTTGLDNTHTLVMMAKLTLLSTALELMVSDFLAETISPVEVRIPLPLRLQMMTEPPMCTTMSITMMLSLLLPSSIPMTLAINRD